MKVRTGGRGEVPKGSGVKKGEERTGLAEDTKTAEMINRRPI